MIKKILKSMTIKFIIVNIVFVFFISIITWVSMNSGMTCGSQRWVSPLIPCPSGEIHYNVSSPFIEVLILFAGIHFGIIFIIFIVMILIGYYQKK